MKHLLKSFFELNDPNSQGACKVVKANKCLYDKEGNLKTEEIVKIGDKKATLVNMLVLLHGGRCNWNCDICYTRNGGNRGHLTFEQLLDLCKVVKSLGAKVLYIPGLGEPFLSPEIWQYIRNGCANRVLPIIVFTNGSYLWDNEVQVKINLDIKKILKLLKNNKIYQYVKFWTIDQEKVRKMYGIDAPLEKYGDINVPRSLAVLLDNVDKERIGVEVVVRRDNVEEVCEKIVPFCEKQGINCLMEVVIPVNKVARELVLSGEELKRIENYLAIKKDCDYCKDRMFRDLVVIGDKLAPCIVFKPKIEHRVVRDGKVVDEQTLFWMWHDNYFAEIRRAVLKQGCSCAEVVDQQ